MARVIAARAAAEAAALEMRDVKRRADHKSIQDFIIRVTAYFESRDKHRTFK